MVYRTSCISKAQEPELMLLPAELSIILSINSRSRAQKNTRSLAVGRRWFCERHVTRTNKKNETNQHSRDFPKATVHRHQPTERYRTVGRRLAKCKSCQRPRGETPGAGSSICCRSLSRFTKCFSHAKSHPPDRRMLVGFYGHSTLPRLPIVV